MVSCIQMVTSLPKTTDPPRSVVDTSVVPSVAVKALNGISSPTHMLFLQRFTVFHAMCSMVPKACPQSE